MGSDQLILGASPTGGAKFANLPDGTKALNKPVLPLKSGLIELIEANITCFGLMTDGYQREHGLAPKIRCSDPRSFGGSGGGVPAGAVIEFAEYLAAVGVVLIVFSTTQNISTVSSPQVNRVAG